MRRVPFQSILDLLDAGLVIYRRGWLRFLTISALGLVPLAIGLGLVFATSAYGQAWPILLGLFVWLPASMLVIVVAAGAISRSAVALRAGQPLSLGAALGFGPKRVLGMGCFGTVFLVVVNIVSSIVSCVCFLPLYGVLLGSAVGVGAGLGASGFNEALAVLFGIIAVSVIIAVYGLSLVLGGATYCSFVYGLQPFALETMGLGAAMNHSLAMLFHRFGRNLLAFMLTSLAFAALAGVVTIAAGVLIPLPISLVLGAESPMTQVAGASAWLLGLMTALPLLPIWMALLYHENRALQSGGDLAERIAALQ